MTRKLTVALLALGAMLLAFTLYFDFSWRMAFEQGTPFYNQGVRPVQNN